jgi:anaerobic selenocysteine-containing dehydrogenase
MNALIHELIARDLVDHDYVERHAVGFDELAKQTADCTVEYAEHICDVPAGDVVRAAELLGGADALLSTVLQGFYQAHQATASAVQVNNIHLVLGMLGRPGAGVLQMNGQPTAQNTRECGANGDLPGFRNWQNDDHIAELARIWNLKPSDIPHFSAPTPAMQIFRYAEQGSVAMLWVSGTNPAVSLPELHRIRSILAQDRLFLVVQDIFLTETAQFADVVLPAATWGEKTGTFTNADRTVHLSDQAVPPPGEARSDLAIFCDYARRMDFRDQDGAPLVSWSTPESAFAAWQECAKGRPCDYTGIDYEGLRRGSGIQWPCNNEYPAGRERLYQDGRFYSAPDYCETYGKDLVTGASMSETEYRALNPDGKAILRAAHYTPPHEAPSDEFPFALTTGRTIFHFHTRTKTARAPQLDAAAPDVWVEMSAPDATAHDLEEGDLVEVASPRSSIQARLRVGGIRPGTLFVPFHYGYFDRPGGDSPSGGIGRAGNELTLTQWDPASKQPIFKTAAAKVTLVSRSEGVPSPAPTNTASRPEAHGVRATVGGLAAMVRETPDRHPAP